MLRTFKTGLLGLAVAGLLGLCASAGCSADGSAGDLGPATGTNPTDPGSGSKLPPSGDSDDPSNPADDGDDGDLDAGKKPKDGGTKPDGSTPPKTDAGTDAGPTAPESGAFCARPNDRFVRSCGLCGWQDAICRGNNTVSPYSACQQEQPNGCVPGSVDETSCGNCGVIRRTCNNYCKWDPNATCVEPANACVPGTVDYLPFGCSAGEFHATTCSDRCQWNAAEDQCKPPPSFVSIAPLSKSNYTVAYLRDGQSSKRLKTVTCPSTLDTLVTPYTYVEIRNPYTRAASVSVLASKFGAQPVTGTLILAAYSGSTPPSTDALREACVRGVTSNVSGAPKLEGTTNMVVVPPKGSAIVYLAAGAEFDPNSPSKSTGPVRLDVRTEAFAP